MKSRVTSLLLVGVAVSCAAPTWAWRTSGSEASLKKHYEYWVTTALKDAEKALKPEKEEDKPDINKARYVLLAVSDLCVPAGGYSAKVSDELVASYNAMVARAWLEGQVPDEATFTETVKQYAPKFQKAYIRAFDIADNAESSSVKRVAEDLAKAAAKHPDAVKLALEYAGKSIPPEAYQKYFFSGDEGSKARNNFVILSSTYGGPETIRQVCQETFIPNALDSANRELANVDLTSQEPGELKMRAGFVQEYVDFILWADPENEEGKALAVKTQEIRDKAKAIYAASVKANRVPPDKYGMGDAAEIKEQMKGVFMLETPHTILKVVIPSTTWVEKAHVWSGINAIDVGWYKLIDGAVVVKLEDGTVWVHPVTFGRRWTGEGDNYGDLMVYGWADRYEVLPANLNK